jgi:hypothetical protein
MGGAEGAVALDVDVVGEAVAFDLFGELLPLLGEAYAGDRPFADEFAHVVGRVGDREPGLAVDVALVTLPEL